VSIRAEGELAVRAVRPGDRLPLAGGGHQRVGRMLRDHGVARHLRNQVQTHGDTLRIASTNSTPSWA